MERLDGVTAAKCWNGDPDREYFGGVFIDAAEEYIDVADDLDGAMVWADKWLKTQTRCGPCRFSARRGGDGSEADGGGVKDEVKEDGPLWERVDDGEQAGAKTSLHRIPVPGGWLYKATEWEHMDSGVELALGVGVAFVPFPSD